LPSNLEMPVKLKRVESVLHSPPFSTSIALDKNIFLESRKGLTEI